MFDHYETGATVHIVERMAPGGIETLVLDLLGHGGGRVHAFSLQGTTEELTAQWHSLAEVRGKLEAFNRLPGLRPGLIAKLARRLRGLKAQVAVAHHSGPLLYGGIAARLAGVSKLIHVEHDVWHYEQGRSQLLLKLCERALRPDHITVSESVAAGLASIIPEARISVVPLGIDTSRFLPCSAAQARAALGLDPSLRIIGTVGRLETVKGHIFLIEAMRHLPQNVHAVIVGDGPERTQLEETARRVGVQDRVQFLGHRDDIEKVLPAFDVFCLPSLAEGLPRCVLEAQSCDVPIVATEVGSLPRAVCPETGYLVPSRDAVALSDALNRCLVRTRQSGQSREFIEKQYAFADIVNAFSINSTSIE